MKATGGPSVVSTLSRRKRVTFAFLSAAIALLFCFVVIEVVLRVILYRQARFFEKFQAETLQYTKQQDLRLRDVVVPTESEAQVFRLRPNISGTFIDQPLRTNSQGFRGPEFAISKPPDTWRVAVLGDSISFGWGVAESDAFPAVLQDLLNSATPTSSTRRYEVLNFSVPAYNTIMELATLKSDVLQYSPDLLLLTLVNNDAELPNFVRVKPRVFSLKTSFIVEAIKDQVAGLKWGDTARTAMGGIADTTSYVDMESPNFRPEHVPEEYRFLLGPEAQAAALKEIVKICQERDIQFLCLVYENIEKPTDDAMPIIERNYFEAVARQAGWPVCNPSSSLAAVLKQPGSGRFDLWVSPGDLHPNARAHRIIAERLLQCIRETYPTFSGLSFPAP